MTLRLLSQPRLWARYVDHATCGQDLISGDIYGNTIGDDKDDGVT